MTVRIQTTTDNPILKDACELFWIVKGHIPSCMYYNDTVENYSTFDPVPYKDCYVRIVVTKRKDEIGFTNLCEALVAAGVANLSVVEEVSDEETGEKLVDVSKGTIELINDTIDEMELSVDKSRLKSVIRELYVDSLSL